jgi:putative ABC transport system substrate-binding protein
MRRREFMTLLGRAAAAPSLLWPLAARAQQMPEIGFLRNASAQGSENFVAGLRKGLAESGFVEGRNINIVYAWSEGQTDRLPALAADLVRRRVAVIVTSAIAATTAAKAATSIIPIVFAIANDAVAFGLVGSLNRPGGNLTGVSYLTSELGGKRLGLMHEMLPRVTDFAMLAHPNNPTSHLFVSDAEAAARSVGLRVEVFNAATDTEIETAFAALTARKAGALLVANDPSFTTRRAQIIALAEHHRVPTIYTLREFAESGGLISYGPSLPDVYRLAGGYAARILKGDKPADLPVLLPTTFEMVLNLNTARALGLDVPTTVRALADKVIE